MNELGNNVVEYLATAAIMSPYLAVLIWAPLMIILSWEIALFCGKIIEWFVTIPHNIPLLVWLSGTMVIAITAVIIFLGSILVAICPSKGQDEKTCFFFVLGSSTIAFLSIWPVHRKELLKFLFVKSL
jgi:hypothetical protein